MIANSKTYMWIYSPFHRIKMQVLSKLGKTLLNYGYEEAQLMDMGYGEEQDEYSTEYYDEMGEITTALPIGISETTPNPEPIPTTVSERESLLSTTMQYLQELGSDFAALTGGNETAELTTELTGNDTAEEHTFRFSKARIPTILPTGPTLTTLLLLSASAILLLTGIETSVRT